MTRRRFAAEAGFLLAAVLVALAVNCLVVLAREAREAARSAACMGNLKQLALALHVYHEAHGSFPPAYTLAADGHRAHSWRALSMANSTYLAISGYDRSVSWDEPPNLALLDRLGPNFPFWCPSDEEPARRTTDYVAVVDPSTAWPGERPLRIDEIGDGTKNTILLVEVLDSEIGWTEPRDFGLDEFLDEVALTRHDGYFNAVFADGIVRKISTRLPREVLRALLTANGGETVDLDAIGP